MACTIFSSLVTAGCMMWTAHFVGMLAYQPDVPITFDVRMTWLSFVMPVVFAAVAVQIVTRHPESVAVLVVGGATMTMGLVALHYGGVAAMRTPAHITHDASLVVISIVLAFVTSTGALTRGILTTWVVSATVAVTLLGVLLGLAGLLDRALIQSRRQGSP